ncbi:MAG TPA: hypothetical protein VLH75_06710 [Longimicrobiales bacterium]|nr:hypothetical protein [Longimicrobiales bacterium]
MSRLGWGALILVLAGSVLMDLFGPAKEPKNVWDVKAFFAVYGFVGCVAIIFVSKWLGAVWLQRDEDYYEAFRAPSESGDVRGDDDEAAGHA